jgi:hypothetical protein
MEKYTPTQPEQFPTKETLARKKAYELGFIETDAMIHIQKDLIAHKENPQPYFVLWSDHAIELVESIPDTHGKEKAEKYAKTYIGFLICQAALYGDLDMTDEFNEQLDDASQYANGQGFGELAIDIEKMKV